MSQTITPSQLTTPNLTIEAGNGVTYAYRRFGNTERDVRPLVLLQHFRGNLDNWDPQLVDAIAAEREVILFDNTGVGGSSGATPRTITAMAHDALAFLDALGLTDVDVLGFSLGGFVAQELTLIRPLLVHRLVLAGTSHEGGFGFHTWTGETGNAAKTDEPAAEHLLHLFFAKTPTGVAKGWEFVQRIFTRTEDRDEGVSLAARDAQLDAITSWGIPDPSRLARLAAITQPTLVANGDNDIMVPTPNSKVLADHLPNARLAIYPGAGHGFLFHYATEFAGDVNAFLG
ncbi:alpha/beta hydrolase [Amycolatopsis sp. NPDC005232]|uniref:alpha/beta fold hydrolase n=1 Tax=Amycolatopsis sp. NPDC005232 TaxID=3157027 RepID=UPI0033B2E3DF